MTDPTGSTAEQELYREIRAAIAERRLVPGVKLSEDALASLFDLSRARVRKVLLLLAKEHIVVHEPNRGAFVWHPTVQESLNIIEARRLIELHMVRSAAQQATKKQITQLRKILKDEAQARVEQDAARVMRLSGDFHLKLGECGNNPVLWGFLNTLISQYYLILAVYQHRNAPSCPQNDHNSIVDAVEIGDAEKAVELLEAHFGHMEAELNLTDEVDPNKQDLREILRRQG